MTGEPTPAEKTKAGPLMAFVRVWLPILICLSGIAIAGLIRTDAAYEGGALLVSAGVSVFLLNVLFRLGVRGDRERGREREARDYFERHGHWPDEDAGDPGAHGR
ncbi:MAG: hypothetical protein LT070_02180 [Solirubrobacteraceae bacterium]|nr:hypothetical protein [Solirubrobacteraceae bacterium]